MKFGIIGTARIARRIVADMQSIDGVDVVGIASRDPSRAQWYAGQYGIPRAFPDYESLLTSDDIDAVYLPLPPSLHCEWAMRAASEGKHVLVEKPLATDRNSAKKIADACASNGVRWLDATAWLHHERTRRIEEIVSSGALGKITHISSAVSFFEPFQSEDHRLSDSLGGGCLLDLGWYACGLPLWITGDSPTEVEAIGQRRGEVWYRCSSLMQFSSGVTAMANFSYDTATRKWFEIAGDQASLICDDFTRPWIERPTRFWIHDRTGAVTSEEFSGNQEVAMLRRFADDSSDPELFSRLNAQSIRTQSLCDSISAKLIASEE